jgi:hypothetical protein
MDEQETGVGLLQCSDLLEKCVLQGLTMCEIVGCMWRNGNTLYWRRVLDSKRWVMCEIVDSMWRNGNTSSWPRVLNSKRWVIKCSVLKISSLFGTWNGQVKVGCILKNQRTWQHWKCSNIIKAIWKVPGIGDEIAH